MTGKATSHAWSSLEEVAALAAPPTAGKRRALDWRVLLGFFLPVAIALLWEAAVHVGLVQGRLVPPPSRIIATLTNLAATGELWIHVRATLWRVLVGFAIGASRGDRLRGDLGIVRDHAAAARSDSAGASRHSIHRLGAVVHSLAGHFRSIESGAHRHRRLLSGLSRHHGRDSVRRPEAHRGGACLPALPRGDGAAHPAARGAPGGADRASVRPRPRVHVRGGG